MKKQRISGPALFMYSVIGLVTILSSTVFSIYYTGTYKNTAFLWVGIVSFMILYHFGLRILFGEISKKFPLDPYHPFYKERRFERYLYRILHVRKWKDKVLTFDPAAYDFSNRTPYQLARTMCKSELDHWVNELLSVGSIFFFLLWGTLPAFLISAVCAMLFDAQFIVVQRYNRPILLRLNERLKRKETSSIYS